MRNDFLDGARAPLLAEMAAARLLVAFDYDGVLAPLGTAPDGRAMRPGTARLVPGKGIVRVGNHGFELGRAVPVPRRVLAQVADWDAEVARRLDGMPGWHVERAVQAAGRSLAGARLLPGKKVLNVLPASFPTKGDAVRRLLARLRLDVALFLGDDRTDEDVFRLGAPAVVGVRVGAGASLARWRMRSQEDVDEVLERLRAWRPLKRAQQERAP